MSDSIDMPNDYRADEDIVDKPSGSNNDITVLTEGYIEEARDSTTYYLTKTGGKLEFDRASEIHHITYEESLYGCEYRVHSKQFKDMSFVIGYEVKELTDGISIRKYKDGTEFLLLHEKVPTFDSADREWDSDRVVVMYVDEYGITLIDCQYGYRIPNIEVYCGLKKSTKKINELLREIGCDEELIENLPIESETEEL